MRSLRSGSLVAAGLISASVLGSARQGTPPPAPTEAMPGVWMHVSGSYGGGTTSSIALGDDRWYEAVFYAGDTGDRQICMGGGSGPQVGTPALFPGAKPMVTWRVAVRRQAFDGLTATIDVRWSRRVFGDGLQPGDDFDETFTWRASEGATRVLDFVRQVPAAVPGCETNGVTLSYRNLGPDELREAALGYDIWLVQQLPSGERQTRFVQSAANQGDTVTFTFPTVGVDSPGMRNPGGPAIVDLTVRGRIQGHVRRDGRLDLAVSAGRMVGLRGQGLFTGNAGTTRLTVAPEETVELEPPPVRGDTDGIYADALKNARTAIRVRARRLW